MHRPELSLVKLMVFFLIECKRKDLCIAKVSWLYIRKRRPVLEKTV